MAGAAGKKNRSSQSKIVEAYAELVGFTPQAATSHEVLHNEAWQGTVELTSCISALPWRLLATATELCCVLSPGMSCCLVPALEKMD